MPPKRPQYTIYPEPMSFAICGGNAPMVNRSILCWSHVLRQSMPDLDRAEWSYFADLYAMVNLDEETLRFYDGVELGRQAAETHMLKRLGTRHFGNSNEGVAALVEKCNAMAWNQVQYVLCAVAFLGYSKQVDRAVDEWWTIPFRVQYVGAK